MAFLEPVLDYGLGITDYPRTDIVFDRDETDRKFFEVAKYCNALLVTGNLKHYPNDPIVMTMADFIAGYL